LPAGDRADADANASLKPQPPDPLLPRTWLRIDEDGSCRIATVRCKPPIKLCDVLVMTVLLA